MRVTHVEPNAAILAVGRADGLDPTVAEIAIDLGRRISAEEDRAVLALEGIVTQPEMELHAVSTDHEIIETVEADVFETEILDVKIACLRKIQGGEDRDCVEDRLRNGRLDVHAESSSVSRMRLAQETSTTGRWRSAAIWARENR